MVYNVNYRWEMIIVSWHRDLLLSFMIIVLCFRIYRLSKVIIYVIVNICQQATVRASWADCNCREC